MRPKNLHTKIFLDSGDPNETRLALELLGFLDGQTTNPSLITKNPEAQKRIAEGRKFRREELNEFYRGIVQEISNLIPNGSVSIEVYADQTSNAEQLLKQGREMFTWIPNAHIKYPVTVAGLEAAHQSIKEGMRVNITLVFSEIQAVAVYLATFGAKKGDVLLSPFIGRLDDIGLNGIDLIKNIKQLYNTYNSNHVEILAASIRSLDHLLSSFGFGSDIVTSPLKIYQEWASLGMPIVPLKQGVDSKLKGITYPNDIAGFNADWQQLNIQHELTDKGLNKFSEDWNKLIEM